MWDWHQLIDTAAFLDIAFMSLFIYTLLVWFKRTRAAFVLIGIGILGCLYLFARQFNLSLTTAIFQSFFTVILIAVIVIFQEELRYFFERIAVWSLYPNFKSGKIFRKQPVQSSRETEILARTLFDLARDRIGALVVIKGKDFLMRHLEGGTDLNGKLSEALLKSVFDPHSMGHDGAVIIEGDEVKMFSVHLPLSKNSERLGSKGTRHAAALGLSERTDALCLVVSEERGTVSVARGGHFQPITDAAALKALLDDFYLELVPPMDPKPWERFFKKNNREKAIAFGAAFLLWFVLVYGSALVYRTFTVPVKWQHLPRALKVTEVEPPEVKVTFSGSRRNFYLINRRRIRLKLDASDWSEGTRPAEISFKELSFPEGVVLRHIEPASVTVKVQDKKARKEPG